MLKTKQLNKRLWLFEENFKVATLIDKYTEVLTAQIQTDARTTSISRFHKTVN